MTLEMLQVFEDESFGPANRMAAGELLPCWDILQVIFNMVHHFMVRSKPQLETRETTERKTGRQRSRLGNM